MSKKGEIVWKELVIAIILVIFILSVFAVLSKMGVL